MSDSLRGMIPELEEEQFNAFQDAFVIVGLLVRSGEERHEITGNLVGVSVESRDVVKIDVRTSVTAAYRSLKRHAEGGLTCDTCQMVLAAEATCLDGPYTVSSVKVLDFDHQNKMCTLALDLIRTTA